MNPSGARSLKSLVGRRCALRSFAAKAFPPTGNVNLLFYGYGKKRPRQKPESALFIGL
jgi:hypothetical protein